MKARTVLGAVVLALLAASLPSQASTSAKSWKARPATYGVNVTKDVAITMSDGTVLSANVFRPARADGSAAPGRFPVLLVQTPYNKDTQDPHSD
jgi:predicted acyl esterase